MRVLIVGLLGAAATFALLAAPAGAQTDGGGWRLSAGAGLAVELAGSENEIDAPGLAVDVAVTRPAGDDLRLGLRWQGAWFDGRYANESRYLLGLVAEASLAGSRLVVRGGPGLSLATAVEVDFPPADGPPGDGTVGIGSWGALGATAGLAWRMGLGKEVALEPGLDVVYQRAGGFDLLTTALGVRLRF